MLHFPPAPSLASTAPVAIWQFPRSKSEMIFKAFWGGGVSLLPVVQDASSEKWPITPVNLVWRENEHFFPIVLFLNLSSAHSWFILGQNRTTNCTGKKTSCCLVLTDHSTFDWT
uniref:Uncharacterized protein n=1 Tax=Micrurus surinamensis TaxID=129470 RepID=A0A2D4NSY7_MICSU